MNDERPHMIRHRLKALAEGRWNDPGIALDLAALGVSDDALARIQRQAQELLDGWSDPE